MSQSIPSGTVTFLFSDIESSTRQWEQHQEWMQWAFARQETLIREAMASCGGYVYKMIGDAFQVAFDTASCALHAAIAAQRALESQDWGEHGPIRVRMALHTGVTEERGDDYVGPALNRVARVLNAGYGGQILMTQATFDLLQDDLPPGIRLHDMGEHRLKDLLRDEHIYQVVAEDLQEKFPRLKTLSAMPNNLPVQRTSFVGREKEMAEVRRLIDSHRLVTLTGPGGTGKTRLALQVASELLESYEDGVWLVELAALSDPLLIPITTASALGIAESPGKSATQVLVEHLHSRSLLLIFDNCEHVLEDSLAMIDTLLGTCPNLHVLTTSREILGASGEANFRCPSLGVPNPRRSSTFEELAQSEAVQLFIDRAASVSPGLELTPQNIHQVARICQRLDGIPLAIELAAARVRMLTIEGIAARLDDAFRLLTGGSRSALPRQQTLRACIDWSYNLLSEQERLLLRRLSVFAGGWILEAAEQVCADPVKPPAMGTAHIDLAEEDIFDLLGQLVDKSLVMAMPGEEGETRFRLLDTIRQYARERMLDEGDAPLVRDRHLAYYLLLAEEAEPHLRGKHQVKWLDRVESELDNIRFALEWSLSGEVEAGMRLASALLWFWHIREFANEGAEWLVRLIEMDARQSPDPSEQKLPHRLARAKALRVAGMILLFRYQPERGTPMLRESAEIFRELGEAGQVGLGITLIYLAGAPLDWEERFDMVKQAQELLHDSEDRFYLAETMMVMGHLLAEKNELDQARRSMEDCLGLRMALDDLDGMGMVFTDIGNLDFRSGRGNQAVSLFQKAMECFQKVGNKRLVMNTQSTLGTLALLQGDIGEATSRFEAGIRMGKESGDRFAIGQALYDLGRLAWEQGDYQLAEHYFKEMGALSKDHRFDLYLAYGLASLAYTTLYLGNPVRAHSIYRDAIAMSRAANGDQYDPFFIAPTLATMAELLVALDLPERATRLYALVNRSPVWDVKLLTPKERDAYQTGLAAARAALSPEAFSAAWAEGERMTLAEAVDLALQEPEANPS